MSEAYQNFAKEVFGQMKDQIGGALNAAQDMPVLVVNGYEHVDGGLENALDFFTSAQNERPALGAAYPMIASIQASADLAGKENVLVSFEFDQKTLQERAAMVQQTIDDPHLSLEDMLEQEGWEGRPIYYAMEFALKNGYEITGSDPRWGDVNDVDFPPYDPRRLNAEIDALSAQATRTENPPAIVVHAAGPAHFGTLQGYDIGSVSMRAGLTKDESLNPFEGIYAEAIFFNSFQQGSDENLLGNSDRRVTYARNEDNAVQIELPGALDASDIENMTQRIKLASEELKDTPAVVNNEPSQVPSPQ